MPQYKIKSPEWIGVATSFLVSSTLHAAIAPINISLSSGAGSNIISIGPGQTATVEYLIRDIIGRPPARTWLWAGPIPAFLSRIASLHQPDCSVYNQNPALPNSFALPPNGFCYLAMEVNGTRLASTGAPATYKPIFTNGASLAYGPCEVLQLTPKFLPGILLAGGSYLDALGIQRPMLVSSRDQGLSWIYPDAIPNVPSPIPFVDKGIINATSCTGATCIAAGQGEDSNFNIFPLLAVSQDSALTWNYITELSLPVFTLINLSPYLKNGLLNSASCSDNVCIAGGQYEDTNSIARPLLAISQNKGVSWNYPIAITEPVFTPDNTLHPFNNGGIFSGVSCNSPLCVAAGSYFDGTVIRPLLAFTQNAGTSWTFPTSITSVSFTPLNLNPFKDQGILNGASCSASHCVAAGGYLDTLNVTRPLITVTNDAGNSWTYPALVTAPVVNPVFTFGFFNAVSCSQNTCVAAGTYNDSFNVSYPLLAVSQNAGITWSYPANISMPVFVPTNPNPFANGFFNSVSCSRLLCVAVGSYTDTNSVTRPLMAISHDGGSTWTYPEALTNPSFTPITTNPFSDDGAFRSVSCDGNNCLASGSYLSNGDGRPLIAQTSDGGVNWTFPNTITSPNFSPVNTFPFDSFGALGAATATSVS